MAAEDTITGLAVAADCAEVFTALKRRRKHKFITFKVVDKEIQVDTASAPRATADDFLRALPSSACRFAVYDHEIKTSDGRVTSKLLFFSWLPRPANYRDRMTYTVAKKELRAVTDGVIDVNCSTLEEVREQLGVKEEEEGSDWEA